MTGTGPGWRSRLSNNEDREVKKDIQWLKEEVLKLQNNGDAKTNQTEEEREIGRLQKWAWNNCVDRVYELIDQLDEPEILSQEWIDKHAHAVAYDGMPDDTEVVYVDDLQNLLVPKQELPVIPKFVADWVQEVKPDNSLRVAFEYVAQQKRENYDDELAFWIEEGNSETFARAWLDGFTVEKEPLYR